MTTTSIGNRPGRRKKLARRPREFRPTDRDVRAAQQTALAWPPGEGLTIELPVGSHWGERERVAKLFTTLLAEEYRAGWISRASHDLRGVLPEASWPCLAALDAGASDSFDAFNRWVLDAEHRLRRPECTPPATAPEWYVPVRFAFVASADAPRVANTHWTVWAALFVAGMTSLTGGLTGAGLILVTGHRIGRAARGDDGDEAARDERAHAPAEES